MPGKLEGKVALVTGGGSGIGRAAALAFHREGANIVVCDLNDKAGKETVKEIEELGGKAILVCGDVAEAGDVEGMVNMTIDVFGQLDCAFNNAGVGGVAAFTHEYPEENWEHVININLKGVWLCMKYEIRQMLKQGGGAIVNTSSAGGLVGVGRGSSAYVATKHGVIGLTKAAALEYAQKSIRVNAVCPGPTMTPWLDRAFAASPAIKDELLRLVPNGRFGEPEEIAETVVWLCSDAASFVTGHAMAVDGGYVAQ